MAGMNSDTRSSRLRSQLIRRRDELMVKIEGSITRGSAIASPDENDAASFTADGDLALRVATIESVALGEIEQALQRIDSGEYGLCKNCDSEINSARLKALPHATLCIDCKQLEEQGNI